MMLKETQSVIVIGKYREIIIIMVIFTIKIISILVFMKG